MSIHTANKKAKQKNSLKNRKVISEKSYWKEISGKDTEIMEESLKYVEKLTEIGEEAQKTETMDESLKSVKRDNVSKLMGKDTGIIKGFLK